MRICICLGIVVWHIFACVRVFVHKNVCDTICVCICFCFCFCIYMHMFLLSVYICICVCLSMYLCSFLPATNMVCCFPQFYEDAGFPCPPFRNPSDHFLWVINSSFEEVCDHAGLNLQWFHNNIEKVGLFCLLQQIW